METGRVFLFARFPCTLGVESYFAGLKRLQRQLQ
jgi:hypothetical protein